MAFSTTAENLALTGLLGDGTVDINNFISLHDADPGDTGANEITGGTYAREATDWSAAAASATGGSTVTLDVPAGITITHWGLWSASSGGTFICGDALPAPEAFGSAGTYAVTPTITASE